MKFKPRTLFRLMRSWLASCLFFSCGLTHAEQPLTPAQQARPNVLMISIDDLNDWTGFLGGHPDAKTPFMDALAKRGRNFSNAHCAIPVCSSSRVSVMSGVGATVHGSYELGPRYEQLPALKDVPTMQGFFKQHGYTTIAGGKVLHHGFGGRLAKDLDQDWGRQKSPRPSAPMNRPARWSGAWDWGAYPEEDAQMFDLQLARKAADALQQAAFEKPFFMSVGFYRPHVPLYVPPKWFEGYDVDTLTLPKTPASDLADIPKNFQGINDYAVAPTHAEVLKHGKQRSLTQAYLASISFVDHCVGIVVNALANSPHADNTILVLWSDHGFHLGEKQHWAKRTLWEESTRVPLLFVSPGIEPGPCGEPASLLDIYPTLIELCKLPTNPQLEGLSLVPQLGDMATPRTQPAITSSYFGNHAIRSRDWRLIVYKDGAEELYDHRNDPDEFRNLAGVAAHKIIRDELAQWLPKQAVPEFKATSERDRVR